MHPQIFPDDLSSAELQCLFIDFTYSCIYIGFPTQYEWSIKRIKR